MPPLPTNEEHNGIHTSRRALRKLYARKRITNAMLDKSSSVQYVRLVVRRKLPGILQVESREQRSIYGRIPNTLTGSKEMQITTVPPALPLPRYRLVLLHRRLLLQPISVDATQRHTCDDFGSGHRVKRPTHVAASFA